MINEALPVVGPLQEIVHLTLERGPAGDLPVLAGGIPGGVAPFRGTLDQERGRVQALAAGRAGSCKSDERVNGRSLETWFGTDNATRKGTRRVV
jgi:hypothetical protein